MRTLQIAYGDIVQVGYGVNEDDGPDVEHPEVHMMLINPDAEGPDEGDTWACRLTAEEADQLAVLLRKAAEDLRRTRLSLANAARRQAELDARAERVLCVICDKPFGVPVTQRGEPIAAERFVAACSASGMPARCPTCRSKADWDALDAMQRFINYSVGLGDR